MMIAAIAPQMALSREAYKLKQTPTAIIQHVNRAPHAVHANMLKRQLAAETNGLRADTMPAGAFAQKPADFTRWHFSIKAMKTSAAVERFFVR